MTTIKLTCPRHKRWNAALHFEAGIKGGCTTCLAIWKLYLEALRVGRG